MFFGKRIYLLLIQVAANQASIMVALTVLLKDRPGLCATLQKAADVTVDAINGKSGTWNTRA